MAKSHYTPAENASNMQNANKGTRGTNRQYDQNQGNRGWQLNPQNPANMKRSSSKKHYTPAENTANMQNANKGTRGINRQYDQNQGNRGAQLNPQKHSTTIKSKK